MASSWATLENNWVSFIQTSGHTGSHGPPIVYSIATSHKFVATVKTFLLETRTRPKTGKTAKSDSFAKKLFRDISMPVEGCKNCSFD